MRVIRARGFDYVRDAVVGSGQRTVDISIGVVFGMGRDTVEEAAMRKLTDAIEQLRAESGSLLAES